MCSTCTCGTAGGSVTGSAAEMLTDWKMWLGSGIGIAAAVTVTFVAENILWIGLGLGGLVAALIAWRVGCLVREYRRVPPSALWTPDKAVTVPRGAIGAARPAVAGPARTALPGQQKALPAAQPVLGADLAASLVELAGPILAVQAAKERSNVA